MQALARSFGYLSKFLEPDGGVDEVTQNKTGRLWLSAQKQCGSLIKKRRGKPRITLNALYDGLLEVASPCHVITVFRTR